jgi:hypothetical protein
VLCARSHDLAQSAALALARENAMAHDEGQQGQQARQNARNAEVRQPAELRRIRCGPEHRRVLSMRFEPDHLAEIRRGAGIEDRQRCGWLVRHAAEVRSRVRRLASLLQERRTIFRLRLSHLPFVLDVRCPRREQREQRQRTDQPDQRGHPTVATQDQQLLAHDCADHA